MSVLSTPQSAQSPGPDPASRPTGVDPRGQRFAASVTVLVLAVALVAAPGALTLGLLTLQLAVFTMGVLAGPARTPYSWLFRTFVRPRLQPPAELESAGPPTFAQGVGLVFAVVALTGYAVGAPLLGSVAAGLALAAAFLNAAFDYCLGCELYLVLRRLAARAVSI